MGRANEKMADAAARQFSRRPLPQMAIALLLSWWCYIILETGVNFRSNGVFFNFEFNLFVGG